MGIKMRYDDYIKRKDWIVKYLKITKEPWIDILNEKFVEEYIKEFNSKFEEVNYGALKCKEISNILTQMYKDNILNRNTHGVTRLSTEGFPKWVYIYSLQCQFKILILYL